MPHAVSAQTLRMALPAEATAICELRPGGYMRGLGETATLEGPHLLGTLADEGPAPAPAVTSVPSGLREAAGGCHSSVRPGHVSRTRGAGQWLGWPASRRHFPEAAVGSRTHGLAGHTPGSSRVRASGCVALRSCDSATKPQQKLLDGGLPGQALLCSFPRLGLAESREAELTAEPGAQRSRPRCERRGSSHVTRSLEARSPEQETGPHAPPAG